MSHTPAPWGVCTPDSDSTYWEVASESHLIATIWHNDRAAAEANARLIAAAPDLLAVCSSIAHDLALLQFTDGECLLAERAAGVVLQSLREVIAKAEGRE